ncbi:hypothetical protein HB662_01535 [Roseomonas frigidaquae]|uniref:Uncharacterized protein n=1 Tax=Falsiroseomonas frigidaquae TaxID=487318 RepID=A0ABX1ES45_9PROT|nr:hypothetical protein [Falsiroseomonas frigidaquae]NKE43441.1 hypothetical protein [Falsiroseomonas frigidaquae]
MKLVVDNSEALLAQRSAAEDTRTALAQLAANLLRVARGAGRPAHLPNQALQFLNAVMAWQEAGGAPGAEWPWVAGVQMELDFDFMQKLQQDDRMELRAQQHVIRGALQIAASRMLGQLTHERAGERELRDGIRDLWELQEERRKAHQAAIRASRPKVKRAKPKAKRKAAKPRAPKAPAGEI